MEEALRNNNRLKTGAEKFLRCAPVRQIDAESRKIRVAKRSSWGDAMGNRVYTLRPAVNGQTRLTVPDEDWRICFCTN